MITKPLTMEEIEKANAYLISCGPDQIQEKTELWNAFKAGPDTFNPMIRSKINPSN